MDEKTKQLVTMKLGVADLSLHWSGLADHQHEVLRVEGLVTKTDINPDRILIDVRHIGARAADAPLAPISMIWSIQGASWIQRLAPALQEGTRVCVSGARIIEKEGRHLDRLDHPCRIEIDDSTMDAELEVSTPLDQYFLRSVCVTKDSPSVALDGSCFTKYTYKRLDALGSHGTAHFYGLVCRLSPISATKGRHHVLSFRIIDRSLFNGNPPYFYSSVAVNLFDLEADLPQDIQTWDIIRCHRAQLGMFQDKPQAALSPSYRSSYVLFKGEGTDMDPYFSNYPNHHFDHVDEIIISNLRDLRKQVLDVVDATNANSLLQENEQSLDKTNHSEQSYSRVVVPARKSVGSLTEISSTAHLSGYKARKSTGSIQMSAGQTKLSRSSESDVVSSFKSSSGPVSSSPKQEASITGNTYRFNSCNSLETDSPGILFYPLQTISTFSVGLFNSRSHCIDMPEI